LISRLTAKIVDEVSDFYSIYDAIDRSPLDAVDRDWHAENRSCSVSHKRKKFTISMFLFHCMALNKASFWLVMAVEILMVPYIVHSLEDARFVREQRM
jgi:hypothetical protein